MDIFNKKKKTYIFAGGMAGLGCILMIAFPSAALLSAQKGISLWAGSVLPALLPFFICANFMNYLGITAALSPGGFAFTMSVLSGYPMGAKLIGDMSRGKYIDKKRAERLLAFCSTSGPTFMIGAVGAGMLNSPKAGAVIAISHYSAAVLNGIIFTALRPMDVHKDGNAGQVYRTGFLKTGDSILDIFTEAILASFKSLGIVLAYIVMFMFITDVLQFSGLLNFIASPLTAGLIKGIFEMTVGCGSVTACYDQELFYRCVICAGIISFGGLSVIGQTMSMLAGTGISLPYFLGVKICHGILAAILAFIIGGLVIQL